MHTLHNKIFSLVFSLIAVLFLASCARSQNQLSATAMATRGPHPAWEGTASGKPQPFTRNNDDLRMDAGFSELLFHSFSAPVSKCANAQTPQQKLFTLAHPFPRATVGNDQLKGFLYAVHKRTYPLY